MDWIYVIFVVFGITSLVVESAPDMTTTSAASTGPTNATETITTNPTSETATTGSTNATETTTSKPTSETATSGHTNATETTTPKPTSETKTTGPTNATETTTPKPTSETTHTMQTTMPTTAQPPGWPKFMVNDGNKTCILMQGYIVFHIPYMRKNQTEESMATVSLPSNATVTGSCSETSQSIVFMFFKEWVMEVDIEVLSSLTLGADFRDQETAEMYAWKRLKLTYVFDENFPDAEKEGTNATMENSTLNAFQANMSGSYKCAADQNLTVANGTFLEFQNFQYSAFGTTNSTDFPKDPFECAQDMSTTSAATTGPTNATETTTTYPTSKTTHTSQTTMSTTTQPPGQPKFMVNDGNKTCIIMQGHVVFHIPYVLKNQTKSMAAVNLTSNATVTGWCNETSQSIVLMFFKEWVMEVDIKVMSSLTLGADFGDQEAAKYYAWEGFSLTYVFDDHFPDAEKEGTNATVENSTLNAFKTSMLGSYRCNADQTLTVNDDVSLEFKNFQYTAFRTTNATDFPKDGVTECAADSKPKDNGKDKHVLAIGLGVGLGVPFIIIIIVGIIWLRKRKIGKRKNYERVE